MKRALLIVAVVLVTIASASSQAQSSPLVGTWKLNLSKSTFDPGPGPTSLTRTVEAQGDGVKYTFSGVTADGKTISYGFSVQFDGKDNPINGSIPSGADTISAKRIDSHHFVATLKKAGNVIGTSKVSVSEDGTSTTVDSSGTNAAGVKSHDVQIFDKQ
jgi:hypothetical protein